MLWPPGPVRSKRVVLFSSTCEALFDFFKMGGRGAAPRGLFRGWSWTSSSLLFFSGDNNNGFFCGGCKGRDAAAAANGDDGVYATGQAGQSAGESSTCKGQRCFAAPRTSFSLLFTTCAGSRRIKEPGKWFGSDMSKNNLATVEPRRFCCMRLLPHILQNKFSSLYPT